MSTTKRRPRRASPPSELMPERIETAKHDVIVDAFLNATTEEDIEAVGLRTRAIVGLTNDQVRAIALAP